MTTQSVEETIAELVLANRILFAQGVLDAFGHVSVRNPENPDHFFLARSMAPALVNREDILEFDLDAETIGDQTAKPYLERFIHSEILRERHDVVSVVHSHSLAVIPFGVTSASIKPIFHMSSFLQGEIPTFEIREAAGETDLLIRNQTLGRSLAESIGNHSVVLQRGHGSVVVGGSLKEAVFRAVYLEVNARLQIEASTLGPIDFLTSQEAVQAEKTIRSQIGRAWDMWARGIDLDFG
jgi:ribulose-5-phosphate 4-epimerase/fuculose-1-phosphate aldolase